MCDCVDVGFDYWRMDRNIHIDFSKKCQFCSEKFATPVEISGNILVASLFVAQKHSYHT